MLSVEIFKIILCLVAVQIKKQVKASESWTPPKFLYEIQVFNYFFEQHNAQFFRFFIGGLSSYVFKINVNQERIEKLRVR